MISQYVEKASSLIAKYDFFLVDIHGVIHDGVAGFPEAIDCVNRLSLKKPIYFLSNNPRRNWIIQQKIQAFGIDPNIQVITSGELVLDDLQNNYPSIKNIFHLGSKGNTELFMGSGLSVKTVDRLEEAELIVLTLNVKDKVEMDSYLNEIDCVAKSGLVVLCANPDKIAPHGGINRICAGTFALLLEERGVNVQYMGKPERNIYEYLLQLQPTLKGKKGLMIGDTLETDVLFAKRAGIDSLLVLSGITGQTQGPYSNQALIPEYYTPKLIW